MGSRFGGARVSWGQDRLVRVSESCRAMSPVALKSHNLIARDHGLSSTTRRRGGEWHPTWRAASGLQHERSRRNWQHELFPAGHPKTWQKVELKGERLKVST
jgi:hypothetical protein